MFPNIPIFPDYHEKIEKYAQAQRAGTALPIRPGSPVIAEVPLFGGSSPEGAIALGSSQFVMDRDTAAAKKFKVVAGSLPQVPAAAENVVRPDRLQETDDHARNVIDAKKPSGALTVLVQKGSGREFAILQEPSKKGFTENAARHYGRFRGHAKSIHHDGITIEVGERSQVVKVRKSSPPQEGWDVVANAAKVLGRSKNPDGHHRTFLECTPAQLRVEPVAIRPNDEVADWFPSFVELVKGQKVDFHWWRPYTKNWLGNLSKELCEHIFRPRNVEVDVRTLLCASLRLVYDRRGAATIFAYAPEKIAEDIRKQDLARLFGVEFISYFLKNIFYGFRQVPGAENQFTGALPSYAHLSSARDLFVSFMMREDHHAMVHTERRSVEDRIDTLMGFATDLDSPKEADYALQALKMGTVYAAILGAASDIAQHTAKNKALLDGFTLGVTKILSAAAGSSPAGAAGAAAVSSVGDAATKISDQHVLKSDNSMAVIDEAIKHFNHTVVDQASRGYIARWQSSPVLVDAKTAKLFATQATRTLSRLAPKEVEIPFKEE